MTLLPFLVITFGAGAASILTRHNTRVSTAIGLAGLVAAVFAARGISASEVLTIGGGQLLGSAYLRLFVLLGSIVALGLTLLGLATDSHRNTPGVLLGGIGAAGLALALADARIAAIAATAGGLLGILVTIVPPATARGVVVAGRELRALAIAGTLAVLAAAWIARPLGELAAEPAVFGLAYLGFAIAVAIRFGAIPFHFWAARLADAAPEVTLPMLMAWSPAAFAVVALAWADQSVAPLLVPLTVERALIVAVGAVSVVLGTIAALIQDDLEHVVGYMIIADAGIAILGLAALDPAAWEPARAWVIAFVVVRSAFAAWAVAARGSFRTRRIDELGGWIVRAPILAGALALIAVAAIGLPGFVAWEARAALIDLTLDGPFMIAVTAGALAQVAVFGRLLVVGLGRPSEHVRSGPSERPTWPASSPSRPLSPTGASPPADDQPPGRGGPPRSSGLSRGRASSAGARFEAMGATFDALRIVPEALHANRTLIAALIVLALSGLAVGVAAGGFGVSAAAAAVPGQEAGPSGSEPPIESPSPGAESPTPVPSATPDASVSESAVPSASAPGTSLEPPSGPPDASASFQPLPSP